MDRIRSLTVDPALRGRIEALYADCAAALDEGRYDDWVALFTDDCRYVLQPRENHERGLPLATLSFEGTGMLRDRVYGISNTLFHAPYYQRHLIGPIRVITLEGGRIRTEANYAVFRTRLHEASQAFNVGRVIDELHDDGQWLRFASRHVIFDSEMIPNSIIYPI